MLHIKNNSVVLSLVLGASCPQLNTLQNFLYNNHVNACFFRFCREFNGKRCKYIPDTPKVLKIV